MNFTLIIFLLLTQVLPDSLHLSTHYLFSVSKTNQNRPKKKKLRKRKSIRQKKNTLTKQKVHKKCSVLCWPTTLGHGAYPGVW